MSVAVQIRVVVGGLDLSRRVLRLQCDDGDDAVDKVTLQVANPDLRLLDTDGLLGTAPWTVSWGTDGAMARPRQLHVRAVRGLEVLTIEGHARHGTMDQRARTAVYEGQTRSQVMAALAARHGYEGPLARITPTTERFAALHQVAESDAHFLRRLAAEEGFQVLLDDDRLVVAPATALAEPVRRLVWRPHEARGEVISLSVESNLLLVVHQVELRGRDPREKRTVSATATRSPTERRTFGDAFDLVDPETGATTVQSRAARTVVAPTTVPSVATVARRADARLRRMDADALKVTARVVGNVGYRPRQVVELSGASRRLAGRYVIRRARHDVSAEGYTTELVLRRLVGGEGAVVGAAAPARAATAAPATSAAPVRPATPFDEVDPETGRVRTVVREER